MMIKAKRIVTPGLTINGGEVLVDNGRILAVGGSVSAGSVPVYETVDLGDLTLIPGMVDIHNHGALGHWVGDSPDSLVEQAGYLPSTGTTAWLPTVGSAEAVRNIVKAAKSLRAMRGEGAGLAEPVGIHMEGPFLAPKNLPGDDFQEVSAADPGVLREILEAGEGLVRLVGVAPEMPGALELIRDLRYMGINAAVAHTKIVYDAFREAVIAGLNHATHSFNVMTGLHHRRPGVVGGILTEDSVTCELISDGYHVHPAAMKVLIRCKGVGKVCMITDNVGMAGLPDGVYGDAVKKDGTIRRAGYPEDVDGTLYGSAWPMNHNLGVLVDGVGVSLQDAVIMACLNPAVVAGCADRKGSIAPGKDADLTAIDGNYGIHWTMTRGKVAFRS